MNKITLFLLKDQVRNDYANLSQKERVRIMGLLNSCQFVKNGPLYSLYIQDDGGYIDESYIITSDCMLDMTFSVSCQNLEKSLSFKIQSTEIAEPRDMYVVMYMAINRLNEMKVVVKHDADLSQKISERLAHIRSLRQLNEKRWF